MAIKVLFWNINKQNDTFILTIKDVINKLGGVDILLLAEANNISDIEIQNQLNLTKIQPILSIDENYLTPKLYIKLSSQLKLQHLSTTVSKRLCFFTLQTQQYGEIIIAGLHFPSKASYNDPTQTSLATTHARWIKEIETLRGHKKTIVFGDFNMNPFEAGMIEPHCFNATLSADIAKTKNVRTLHFEEYDYFYNPMWNWLGDKKHDTGETKSPIGSYYYQTTTDVTQIYWNVFDKVIVRPDLIEIIDYATLQIVEYNTNNQTDHYPLTFSLKI